MLNAFRNITIIPTNIITMNIVLHGPFSRNTGKSSSFRNEPINSRNDTLRSSNSVMFAIALFIVRTRLVDATTRNPITNDTIALRFFFVYLFPSISSVPNTFVFSSIANTIVNTRRNGRTTS